MAETMRTGGEYTETITGRVMEGVKFSTLGGGGGAGMFSALEWIMKGAVWLVLFVYAGYRAEQRSYGRVLGAATSLATTHSGWRSR